MKCPYCKAEISDDSQFCGNCGKKLHNKVNPSSKLKKSIAACVAACVLIGGGWYVANHFFFINEVFPTFESFIALVDNFVKNDNVNEEIAKECRLEKIYSEKKDEEEFTSIEIVCGKDVEKGNPKEYMGYEIVEKTDHAVYISYSADTSSSAGLYFRNKEDGDSFFKKAMDYGLLIYKDEYGESDTYFIPNKKLPDGSKRVDKIDYDGEYGVRYMISKPEYEDGWYVIHIGIDF